MLSCVVVLVAVRALGAGSHGHANDGDQMGRNGGSLPSLPAFPADLRAGVLARGAFQMSKNKSNNAKPKLLSRYASHPLQIPAERGELGARKLIA